jgi:hypothetical protein
MTAAARAGSGILFFSLTCFPLLCLADVLVVPANSTAEVDFTANNPGATLFNCHNQSHMDFGFMTLFRYA